VVSLGFSIHVPRLWMWMLPLRWASAMLRGRMFSRVYSSITALPAAL